MYRNDHFRIKLRVAGKTHFVKCKKIKHCRAAGSYTEVFLVDKVEPVVCSQTLSSIEKMIPVSYVVRVSQSALVNARLVTCLHHKEREIELECGTRVSFTGTIQNMEKLIFPSKSVDPNDM